MAAVQVRRGTRQEYDRMVAAGVFPPGDRVELLDGEILAMTPQGSAHATAVRLTEEALRVAFGRGYDVRVQMPLALEPTSEPEPDVAVVVGSPRDYRDAHPSSALLVVEVADTTLDYDREQKGSLHARAGIAEYLDREPQRPAPRGAPRPRAPLSRTVWVGLSDRTASYLRRARCPARCAPGVRGRS